MSFVRLFICLCMRISFKTLSTKGSLHQFVMVYNAHSLHVINIESCRFTIVFSYTYNDNLSTRLIEISIIVTNRLILILSLMDFLISSNFAFIIYLCYYS